MNIRDIAENDLSFILEDSVNGFGIEFKLVSPDQTEYNLTGSYTDIGFFIDPQTGVGVDGSYQEIVFRISSFVSQGGTVYPDRDLWHIENVKVNGIKVIESYGIASVQTDKTLGVIKIIAGKINLVS